WMPRLDDRRLRCGHCDGLIPCDRDLAVCPHDREKLLHERRVVGGARRARFVSAEVEIGAWRQRCHFGKDVAHESSGPACPSTERRRREDVRDEWLRLTVTV